MALFIMPHQLFLGSTARKKIILYGVNSRRAKIVDGGINVPPAINGGG